MRVLVCGDRNWTNEDLIFAVLDQIDNSGEGNQISVLIEGEAKGADLIGRRWAELHHVPFSPYPADWELHGRAAGPIRNQQMLTAKPDLVLAFHNDIANSKGTADMVRRADKAGIETRVVTE